MGDPFLEYYARKDVQAAILRSCEDREVAPRYNQGFGKRPDVLQYPGDVLEMAKKGATSFHISEECWNDPLMLKPGMSKKELDENRKGWDLILDIETPHWDYAKLTAYFLIEALKFHDVKSISVKFSGSKGFHIGIPFESFPQEVNGIRTAMLFPEGPRIITAYLQNLIRDMLSGKILEKENLQTISQKTGKKRQELVKDGAFDPFTVIEIDTVLISNRHLFRAPYSLHEKTGLVSIPIDVSHVLEFDKREAEPESVSAERTFLAHETNDSDAKELIIQAFDWWGKKHAKQGPDVVMVKRQEFSLSQNAVKEEHFPECIKKILDVGMDDGKKRALFILLNFFYHMNWKPEEIEKAVRAWNLRQKSPLPESYIQGQFAWHRKQKEHVLPPNCSNKAYYQDLRIACPENICARYKNPVNCALRNERNGKKKG